MLGRPAIVSRCVADLPDAPRRASGPPGIVIEQLTVVTGPFISRHRASHCCFRVARNCYRVAASAELAGGSATRYRPGPSFSHTDVLCRLATLHEAQERCNHLLSGPYKGAVRWFIDAPGCSSEVSGRFVKLDDCYQCPLSRVHVPLRWYGLLERWYGHARSVSFGTASGCFPARRSTSDSSVALSVECVHPSSEWPATKEIAGPDRAFGPAG